MPKICYVPKRFNKSSKVLIELANKIIVDWEAQGFRLNLRQLYYQMVARGVIPNNLRSYKNLGAVINDARLAGLIDWLSIQDRTRGLKGLPSWNSPDEVIKSAASSYHIDMWERQEYRPEVWIEKDALVGVIAGVCNRLDVPFFSCRGYTSQSEMWVGAQRLKEWRTMKQKPVIFHFGDHDPSGRDMTRDIEERLHLFMGDIELKRLALNMDQVEKYNPPPNPAKTTDSRYEAYIAEFGEESWELDALEPKILADLIEKNIRGLVDKKKWAEDEARLADERKLLASAANNWRDIAVDIASGRFPRRPMTCWGGCQCGR